MKRLAILGASGHGKVVADTAECCGWGEIVFFDDDWPAIIENGNWSVKGATKELKEQIGKFDGVVIAIGNNNVRYNKICEFAQFEDKLVTLIHPAAYVSRYALVGCGTVIFAGAIVNAGVTLGKGTILNTGCSIDHDCLLGDSVHVSPGARLAGGVVLGSKSWVGIGACVKQLVHIGNNAIIGAGAAVIRDVSDSTTVVGVPASPLTEKN